MSYSQSNPVKHPRVSVVMPSLNQGGYIGEAIESVLDQGYPDAELVVVDGGSTDNTIKVIKRYERHIAWWVSEPDKGQSDAINKGLARTTGSIVNWLNSDDCYMPGALAAVAEAFRANDALCVCGVTRVFGAGQDRTKTSYVNRASLRDTMCHLLIEQPSTFFSKSVFDELGGVPADLHYVMDRDLWIRFLGLHGVQQVVSIDTPLVRFRHHEDSKTVSQSTRFFAEYANLLHQYCHNPELKLLLRLVAGDAPAGSAPRRDAGRGSGFVDTMVVFFLLKYARDQAQSGQFDLSRELLNRVDISAYEPGGKEWKWVRQQCVAVDGNLAGILKYLRLRYLG